MNTFRKGVADYDPLQHVRKIGKNKGHEAGKPLQVDTYCVTTKDGPDMDAIPSDPSVTASSSNPSITSSSSTTPPKMESCNQDPNFAVICDFLDKFGTSSGLSRIPPIKHLQLMLGASGEPHPDLVALHACLLRKLNMKNLVVTKKNWEKALVNFCLNTEDYNTGGFELHETGYEKLSVSKRVMLLKGLMEAQFDWNMPLRADIEDMPIEELRQDPTGRDSDGNTYWVQIDEEVGLKVYMEDIGHDVWETVAESKDEMIMLLSKLKDNKLYTVEKTRRDREKQLENEKQKEKELLLDAVEVIQKESEENKGIRDIFICEVCSSEFKNSSELMVHYSASHMLEALKETFSHLALNDEKCKICNFESDDKLHVWMHIGTEHEKVNIVLKQKGLKPVEVKVKLDESIKVNINGSINIEGSEICKVYEADTSCIESSCATPVNNSAEENEINENDSSFDSMLSDTNLSEIDENTTKKLKDEWNDNIKQIQEELREMVSGLKSPQKEASDDEDKDNIIKPDDEIKEEKDFDLKPEINEEVRDEKSDEVKIGKKKRKAILSDKSEENIKTDIPKQESGQRRSSRRRETPPVPVSEKSKVITKKIREFIKESKQLADQQPKEDVKSEEIVENVEKSPSKKKQTTKKKTRGRQKVVDVDKIKDQQPKNTKKGKKLKKVTKQTNKKVIHTEEEVNSTDENLITNINDKNIIKDTRKRAQVNYNIDLSEEVPIEIPEKKKKQKIAEITEPIPINKIEIKPPKVRRENKLSCKKCGSWIDGTEKIYPCSSCKSGWHPFCVNPPLWRKPSKSWECPICNHYKLLETLEQQILELDLLFEQAEKRRLAVIKENRSLSTNEAEFPDEAEDDTSSSSPEIMDNISKTPIQYVSRPYIIRSHKFCSVKCVLNPPEIRELHNVVASDSEEEEIVDRIEMSRSSFCTCMPGKYRSIRCNFCSRIKGCTCNGNGTCRACVASNNSDEENKSDEDEIVVVETKMSTSERFLLTGESVSKAPKSPRGRGRGRARANAARGTVSPRGMASPPRGMKSPDGMISSRGMQISRGRLPGRAGTIVRGARGRIARGFNPNSHRGMLAKSAAGDGGIIQRGRGTGIMRGGIIRGTPMMRVQRGPGNMVMRPRGMVSRGRPAMPSHQGSQNFRPRIESYQHQPHNVPPRPQYQQHMRMQGPRSQGAYQQRGSIQRPPMHAVNRMPNQRSQLPMRSRMPIGRMRAPYQIRNRMPVQRGQAPYLVRPQMPIQRPPVMNRMPTQRGQIMNRTPVSRTPMQRPRTRMISHGMRPAMNTYAIQPYQNQQQEYFQNSSEIIDDPDDIIQIDDNDDDVVEIDEVELDDSSHNYQQPMQTQYMQNQYSQPLPESQNFNQYQLQQNIIQPNQMEQNENVDEYEDILTPTLENSTVYDIAEEESIEEPEVINFSQPNNGQVNVFPNYSNNGTHRGRNNELVMVDFEEEEQLARLPPGIKIKRQPVTDHGLVELD